MGVSYSYKGFLFIKRSKSIDKRMAKAQGHVERVKPGRHVLIAIINGEESQLEQMISNTMKAASESPNNITKNLLKLPDYSVLIIIYLTNICV